MKNSEAELDKIIEQLNRGKTISFADLSSLDQPRFAEIEKEFFKAYRPERALIIYGTLAPNKPNHSVVAHIKGEYQSATVKGKLENKGWGAELGYFGFRHASIAEQIEIECVVLVADELAQNWQHLDDFEGTGYRRILAKYELDSGEIGVGNIYAINDSDEE